MDGYMKVPSHRYHFRFVIKNKASTAKNILVFILISY